jgi:hypothetical protein
VELFRKAAGSGQEVSPEAGGEDAVVVDLLRRSGQFEGALSRCRSGLDHGPEPKLKKILEYQSHLIQDRDTARHCVEEALKEGS